MTARSSRRGDLSSSDRESIREAKPGLELEAELRLRFGDDKGRERFEHATQLLASSGASRDRRRAAYRVLRAALVDVTVWATYERQEDVRDASGHVLAALRVFERAYLDLRVLHGVDALERLAPGIRHTIRFGLRRREPVLRAVVQLRRHLDRVQAGLDLSKRRRGRVPTRQIQESARIKLVGLGMSTREANELLRSVDLLKQYRTPKTTSRN